MRRYVIFLCLILFPSVGHGSVDMRLANYFDSWTDLEIPGTGYNLRVTRTYNSRSLFNGMFGFGWCSAFETKFEIQADGSIKLKECGDGRTTLYILRNFSGQNTNKAVDQIINRIRKSKRSLSKSRIRRLRAELMSNPQARERYARQYKVSSRIMPGKTYYALGNSIETLVQRGNYYERALPDGTKQRFDRQGRLAYLYDANGNYVQLLYQRSLITVIKDNTNRQLVLTYGSNGKVRLIRGPGRVQVSYKYTNNDLVAVSSAWGNYYTYQYDKLHNLVRTTYPDKTFKKITYNTNKDWVTSFRGRTGCLETYKYSFSPKNPKGHYWADVVKRCQKKVVTKARFEYWYQPRKLTAGNFLARTRFKINQDTNEIFYSEKFARPIKNIFNGQTTVFSYYPNGLLKTRKFGDQLVSFKYNPKFSKPSEVKVGKERTVFSYDQKGNMVVAKSTSGQRVSLVYDRKGRILSLSDQAKRQVKIRYDDRFGKPKRIERPGVGILHIAYRPNGEIKAVRNTGGPVVARQIASTFNNLLDVVSPAGIELNL